MTQRERAQGTPPHDDERPRESEAVLDNRQLHAAVAQLDQALYNHEQWYKDLLRALIARVPPDAPDLLPDAHRRCRFGQWYESDAAALLRSHPGFAQLGEAHRQMHEAAAGLLQRVADELPIPVAELDQFSNRLDRLRLEIQSLRGELAEAAQNADPLTGARNRAGLLAYLREQHALVRRGIQECSLVMIDIDQFKGVNDRHGHAAGDAVLRSLARRLQAELRPYDRLYRYGGEEFLLVLPESDVASAKATAERLRAAIAAEGLAHPATGETLRVTASFGIAALLPTRPVEDSIDEADKALYRAKASGRNCIAVEARSEHDAASRP